MFSFIIIIITISNDYYYNIMNLFWFPSQDSRFVLVLARVY